MDDSEEPVIDTASDEPDDEEADEEDDEEEEEDEDDEYDDSDDDDDMDTEGIVGGPDEPIGELLSGKEEAITSPVRSAVDVSGGIVSVVESTSGTTTSSDAADMMIALDLAEKPSPEVDGRIVSSPVPPPPQCPLVPTTPEVVASLPSSVVLSHSVMHLELNGSISSSRGCDGSIDEDELIDGSAG